MYTRDQMEEQLKATTKAAIFEKQFAEAFDRVLLEKRSGAPKPYSEKVNRDDYTVRDGYREYKEFTVEGDDHHYRLAKWNSLLKDTAYYYDNPSFQDKGRVKNKLQIRYDDLFEDSWKFPLQTRRDLVTWACNAKNDFLKSKEAPQELLEDCDNYKGLLRKYGPDYDKLKAKLGHVRGLFD